VKSLEPKPRAGNPFDGPVILLNGLITNDESIMAVYASGPPSPTVPAILATGRLATPYPDGSLTRWTAPALPGAPIDSQTPKSADALESLQKHSVETRQKLWLFTDPLLSRFQNKLINLPVRKSDKFVSH
jgi:hypothetical protein